MTDAKTHTRQTSSRKQDHVELCIGDDVAFRAKSPGFETIELRHNALPEINFDDIDTQTFFLGKRIALPLMVSSMTGGYEDAERINRLLAETCQEFFLPMGVGSQRQALENDRFHASFRIVRQVAPHIPITANIGGAEVAKPGIVQRIGAILDLIRADAITVHLNPLQELLQPEGSPEFRGTLDGITALVQTIQLPVIVKEVGAGISEAVARRLLDIGVQVIDVAGAGGTSWAGVELLRGENSSQMMEFWDWGIPTVQCLREIQPLKHAYDFDLVASGGLTSGIDLAKSIALGADLGAAARHFLKPLLDSGQDALRSKIDIWRRQLRSCMFLTGSATIAELQSAEFTWL